MRHFLWIAILIACVTCGGFDRRTQAAPAPEKKPLDNEAVRIAEALAARFDIEQRLEMIKFREALHMFEERLGVTIILDLKALNIDGGNQACETLKELENRDITIPVMKKVRGETALKFVCDQINAVHMIQDDHIRITSSSVKGHLSGESVPSIPPMFCGGNSDDEWVSRDERVRLTPLLTMRIEQKPLTEAVKLIADRGGRSLMISASAKPQATTQVSLSFVNLSFESAATALAESAGLRVMKQGGMLVLVSPERHKELNITPAHPMQFQLGGGNIITLEDFETIGRLANGVKPTDAEMLKREAEKLKQERLSAETFRKEMLEKIEQLQQELGKKKP